MPKIYSFKTNYCTLYTDCPDGSTDAVARHSSLAQITCLVSYSSSFPIPYAYLRRWRHVAMATLDLTRRAAIEWQQAERVATSGSGLCHVTRRGTCADHCRGGRLSSCGVWWRHQAQLQQQQWQRPLCRHLVCVPATVCCSFRHGRNKRIKTFSQ